MSSGLAMQHFARNVGAGAREHQLSARLLPQICAGSYFVIANQNLDVQQLSNLQHAGTYNGFTLADLLQHSVDRYESSDDALARILDRLLSTNSGIALWENAFARPDSPYLSNFKSTYVVYNSDVYHISTSSSRHTIADAIHETHAPYLIGVLACQSPDYFTGVSNALQNLALAWTTCLDGEGYLLWVPDSSTVAMDAIELAEPSHEPKSPT